MGKPVIVGTWTFYPLTAGQKWFIRMMNARRPAQTQIDWLGKRRATKQPKP